MKIDPSKVPPKLRKAIPLAEKWGIPSEAERIILAEKASDKELKDFLAVMKTLDIQFLLAWLPETGKPVSAEQEVFMNLALAVDAVEMELARREPNDDSR